MVEHKIGEIVRRGSTTYMCKMYSSPVQENGFPVSSCDICALNKDDCSSYVCSRKMRSDNQYVYYEVVLEARDGMLFRASDGKLYRCTLKDSQSTAHDCACYVYCHNCAYIESEAFGLPGNNPLLHWVPVEEPDMIEKKLNQSWEQPPEDTPEEYVRKGNVTGRPWPSDGDLFYYISGKGNIRSKQYAEGSADEKFRRFNNFFETAEEAAVALEQVKKALNGESTGEKK